MCVQCTKYMYIIGVFIKYVFTNLGVTLTHKNLNAQINSLKTAWSWTNKDVILHALPLNHIHGIVNALMCPLHTGARLIYYKI